MDKPWRNDPLLVGKFNPDYPDDVRVLVHDGNPRISGKAPEGVWVRVKSKEADAYVGICLNHPQAVSSVREGSEFLFFVSPSGQHPFQISEDYLEDRKGWVISPCSTCGFAEMFQNPSERVSQFVEEDDVPPDQAPIMLTTFCPLCGGAQVLGKVGTEAEERVREFSTAECTEKKWWEFWR